MENSDIENTINIFYNKETIVGRICICIYSVMVLCIQIQDMIFLMWIF